MFCFWSCSPHSRLSTTYNSLSCTYNAWVGECSLSEVTACTECFVGTLMSAWQSWPYILKSEWWREKERRERCQTSAGWHSSKVKNSRQGRPIVLARGCTTILSLSLLLSSLSSPSPLPPFSWVFCYRCDASALQSIWCLEALWISLLSLSNWLKRT